MSEKTYNGWSNYETWNVNIWLQNDEGSRRYWDDQAEQLLHYRHHNTPDEAKRHLANQLKSEVTDAAPDLGSSCYADLLNAALGEVNWYEIAEPLIDAAMERVAA